MTTKNKIFAYLFAIIAFVMAAFLHLTADMKGFPDGHLTELDRAEQPLFYVSSILCLLIGLFLLYLARFRKNANSDIIFYGTLALLFLLALIATGLDWYFVETMNHGGGG